MPGIHFIRTVSESTKAVTKLLLISRPVVGVTCKGVEVGSEGELHLLAISTCDGDTYIFDTRSDPDILISGKVHRVLQCNEILKVLHDCSGPTAILLCQHGVHLRNYFDTQMAYSAFMEHQGLPPRRLRLHQLCERYAVRDLYKPSTEVQNLILEDRNVWAGRPLGKEQTLIIASETVVLPVLYDILDSELSAGRSRKQFEIMSKENTKSKLHQTKSKFQHTGKRLPKTIDNIHEEPVNNKSQTQKIYPMTTASYTQVR